MSYELQLKLKENPLYIKYLRENSIWYKRLIRNPNAFSEFREEMRAAYKLRTEDRVERVLDTMNILSNLFSSMV